MRAAVVVFPGSWSDGDCVFALERLGVGGYRVWHRETDLAGFDCVVLPGGFSYGDYLRAGAIARFSPILESVRQHAQEGKLVVGICNGFQILQEAGLLPGVMLRNTGLRFVCRHVWLRTENNQTPFTNACQEGQVLKIPIAHNEGNFFISKQELAELQENQQIIFRYSDAQGDVIPEANPNGSIDSIAGVMNRQGNVMGMMPHPERASEALLSSEDGRFIFKSMIDTVTRINH